MQEAADEAKDEVPFNMLTFKGKLPSSQFSSAIAKMRDTINGYTQNLTTAEWFTMFKPATIQQLKRRFMQYEDRMNKHGLVDFSIVYSQLIDRVNSLANLYTQLRKWDQHKDSSFLLVTLDTFKPIENLLLAADQSLAPDMQIIKLLAQFYTNLKKSNSAVVTFSDLDADAFINARANLDEALRHSDALKQSVVKQEAATEDGDGGEEDAETEGASKGPFARRKRSRNTLVELGYNFKLSASIQVGNLALDLVRRELFKLPEDIGRSECADRLAQFIATVTALEEQFNRKFPSLPESQVLVDMLCAHIVVAKCASQKDADKPTTDTVRAARKMILESLNSSDVNVASWAKPITTYPAGKVLMGISQQHASSLLQDESTSTMYAAAVSKMEKHMGSAFDDLLLWKNAGNQGQPQDDSSILQTMNEVNSVSKQLSGKLMSKI
jgi:hypothetical protein